MSGSLIRKQEEQLTTIMVHFNWEEPDLLDRDSVRKNSPELYRQEQTE